MNNYYKYNKKKVAYNTSIFDTVVNSHKRLISRTKECKITPNEVIASFDIKLIVSQDKEGGYYINFTDNSKVIWFIRIDVDELIKLGKLIENI
ncbi:MAG TPA: hypothetical protein QF753_08430 [Victivallales bacterium]|nr:hypothetical protein [Victivallales bacterium]|tara:strand:+ start:1149 stop:1427 length:279 start_codon:yes stop_codon:yes gene_type:complete